MSYMNFDYIMLNIIFFLVVFMIVYIIDFYFLSKVKKDNKRIDKMTSQAMYMISKYNLDEKKVNLRLLNFNISIINAFIIAFVSTFMSVTKFNMIIQLLVSFVLLFALIYALYELYGRRIKKKWGKQ